MAKNITENKPINAFSILVGVGLLGTSKIVFSTFQTGKIQIQGSPGFSTRVPWKVCDFTPYPPFKCKTHQIWATLKWISCFFHFHLQKSWMIKYNSPVYPGLDDWIPIYKEYFNLCCNHLSPVQFFSLQYDQGTMIFHCDKH